MLENATISIDGLFMNADVGFDEELYKERYFIERTNA